MFLSSTLAKFWLRHRLPLDRGGLTDVHTCLRGIFTWATYEIMAPSSRALPSSSGHFRRPAVAASWCMRNANSNHGGNFSNRINDEDFDQSSQLYPHPRAYLPHRAARERPAGTKIWIARPCHSVEHVPNVQASEWVLRAGWYVTLFYPIYHV